MYIALFTRIFLFFFFNDTATTEIYTLSLHDALPISTYVDGHDDPIPVRSPCGVGHCDPVEPDFDAGDLPGGRARDPEGEHGRLGRIDIPVRRRVAVDLGGPPDAALEALRDIAIRGVRRHGDARRLAARDDFGAPSSGSRRAAPDLLLYQPCRLGLR